MCKFSLHRAFLYQAHPNALVRLLSCTRVGAACPRHFQRTNVMGAASPPLTALLVVRLHLQPSSAPSPGSREDPSSGGGERTSTSPAPAVAERGAEEQKTQRRLPFRKRQPTTPQKKTLFPSVSLQKEWERGPSCSSNPEYQKRTVSTQDWRAWCKQPPSAGRPSSIYFACWPLV